MTTFIRWCFRIGVLCGAGFLICATLLSLEDLGMSLSDSGRKLAESAATLFGLVFMLLGFVLLVDAIHWLRVRWSQLSAFGKFLGIFGLFITTFVGGYIFHFFFARPTSNNYQSSTTVGAEK